MPALLVLALDGAVESLLFDSNAPSPYYFLQLTYTYLPTGRAAVGVQRRRARDLAPSR